MGGYYGSGAALMEKLNDEDGGSILNQDNNLRNLLSPNSSVNKFVTKHVSLRTGVKDGIEWLKDELGYLLISVRAAEAHQDKDLIRLWTDSVRDVANQADVILERFSAQQEEHEQGGVLNRMRRFICKEANLYDMGKDIRSLRKRVVEMKNRREEYRINDIITAATPNVQRRKRTLLRSASFDHEKDVVGVEDDVETLLAQLGNKDPSLGFISIHGMGGLGKSTVASKLYHSSELSHFKRRAWVCVSEDYDIKHVLRKIINAFNGHETDSLNNMEDLELLRKHLRKILLEYGDHYLVVIDDVWDVQVWNKIKNAFPDKNNGSRVIITTRDTRVAKDVHETCFVHELRLLREAESWQLFCKRAKPTPNLEPLGEKMVAKCGGLPLAIVILSGLLSQKMTHAFWSDVKDHLWRKLKGKSSEIQEVLNLSYDDMSFHVRQCFLYLARYPEDHIIEVLELKWLWIAEEFISEADEEDMEAVAEDYLNELANRNMIQIQLFSPEGQVLKCRVHDLVRDLGLEKAREHKMLGIFDSSKQHPNPIRLLQGQSRHAIYNGIGDYLKLRGPNSNVSMLRSLAITKGIVTHKVEVKLMYTRFKYLKVLDLSSVKSCGWIPKEIGDLILLKFLGLNADLGNGATSLLIPPSIVIPPSIGKLKKLQTLIGSGQYIFPKEICELKEIRHLCIREIQGKLNIGNDQTKLQTINPISYTEWFHTDTINWTNLRILVISGSGEGEEAGYNFESIANLTNLRTLRLTMTNHFPSTIQPLSSCKNLKRVFLDGKIKDPEELSFLPYSVTDLTLWNTDFRKDPMPTLRRLSNLTALILAYDAYTGDKMVCSADEFPCLQFLNVIYLGNLRELQVGDGALPSLKAFHILDCPLIKMDGIPQRVMSLPPGPYFDIYLY